MVALSVIATLAYSFLASVAAFDQPFALSENNTTILIVALIGAGASLLQVYLSVRMTRQVNKQRVVVTKHEDGVTVSNEERDRLSEKP